MYGRYGLGTENKGGAMRERREVVVITPPGPYRPDLETRAEYERRVWAYADLVELSRAPWPVRGVKEKKAPRALYCP